MNVATFFLLLAIGTCLDSAKGEVPFAGNARIVGGEIAFAGQWPWAAAVYVTTSAGSYFCGGVLLSEDFVLTAGQCVDGAVLFTILLGTNQLTGNSETVRVATETYFLHPDYNPQTLEHDLGLIKFRESILFTTYIKKAYIPYQYAGGSQMASTIGWGQTTDAESGLVNDLYWVNIQTLTNEECQIYYGSQITEHMLCAIGNYNEGTCVGDTGGPLTQYISRGYNVVIGIASFVSSQGCESMHPSGYTRIFGYNDWIRNITNGAA